MGNLFVKLSSSLPKYAEYLVNNAAGGSWFFPANALLPCCASCWCRYMLVLELVLVVQREPV
jgi:hypothetical protein